MNNKNEIVLPYLEMGGGFMLGLAVGYALKKSFKVLLFILGLGLIALFALESQDIVSINNQNLHTTTTVITDTFQSIVFHLKYRISQYSLMGNGSALLGFFTGIKIG